MRECDRVTFSHHSWDIAYRFCSGRGLDVGCGGMRFPPATGVDVGPAENLPMYVQGRAEGLSQLGFEDLDFVFSSHCLEHNRNWQDILAEFHRVLRPGGTMFLYLPHADKCPEWSCRNCDAHVSDLSPENLTEACGEIGFRVVEHSVEPDHAFSFYFVAEKTCGGAK